MQRIALIIASQNTHVNSAAMGIMIEAPLVTDVGNVVVVEPFNGILN